MPANYNRDGTKMRCYVRKQRFCYYCHKPLDEDSDNRFCDDQLCNIKYYDLYRQIVMKTTKKDDLVDELRKLQILGQDYGKKDVVFEPVYCESCGKELEGNDVLFVVCEKCRTQIKKNNEIRKQLKNLSETQKRKLDLEENTDDYEEDTDFESEEQEVEE